ncbi:N-formylglutamate deformylase [Oleiagrimonas sp. C23AA]|uniref:N-formylglutamate deformylase n=1 Tax=Oleiagrimonas sp. C23AA TaxID=2719047 RepID=UPI001422973C|nr:N-formylglutamate deformylase [Oleiagrimonas sp. C23AA]NII09324.1 N-formylglutamate deformylase [Oleiagrimonas sp. C23AA]
MNDIYHLHRGTAPLLISLPHDGSFIPEAIAGRMRPAARRSPDTDWHVGQLYAFARELGASIIAPTHSRYVIDLNRPADGHALYPGRQETGLVPTIMFDGEPIYLDGRAPDAEDIRHRVAHYWQPYHAALAGELTRLRALHPRVVLWEGHSIRSRVPMLFDGQLPDLNLGFADGEASAMDLRQALQDVLDHQRGFSHVTDGRFKGGYITRHFGRPSDGVNAVQMEMAQLNYMDEECFEYLPERAQKVQPLLGELLKTCLRVMARPA